MSVASIRQIGEAIRTVNPKEVRELAEREIHVGILTVADDFPNHILGYLIPPEVSDAKAREVLDVFVRVGAESDFARCDVGFSEPGVMHPQHFYPFDPLEPERAVREMLDDHEDLWLPLARKFLPVRDEVVDRVIWKICKENALFTVATALPNVIPSWITIPWALGEFASDTAVLTMNQVRMAFLISAASDGEVGFTEQRAQVASIIAAAFGWRGIARQLVSKIPAGGGLVSKGLISFAGTYVVGRSLDKYFRIGKGLTRAERREHYHEAFERGRGVVEEIVGRLRRRGANPPSAPGESTTNAA